MTDCYLYIRFSTPRQEAGSSRERQEELCRTFAESKGWTVVDPIIADLGRSAWKGDHLRKGNLGKFSQKLFDREIPAGSVICVEEIDRLSRQKARITKRWIEDVCDAGYKIATAATGKIYDADNLDENILSLMEILLKAEAAWEYSERLSRRSKASYEKRLKEAREHGTVVHAVGPAWLEAVGKRPNIVWEPIPDRVKLVREMFDLTIAGQAPWSIASAFNQRGEKSFTGRAWERTSIIKTLRNRAVEGDYVVGEGKSQVPTGEVLIGYYPPIIPLDVIAEARAMLDRRSIRKGKGRNSGAINNLFGQKLRCFHCGGRMMTTGYQNRYLACYEANRRNVCTQNRSFRYRPLESAVLDEALHLALDETFFRQAQKSNHIGLEIAGLEKSIRDKSAEADRLVKLLSRIDSPTTEANLAEIEGHLAGLKAKLVRLKKEQQAADGNANAQAHLERVHGVREALSHPQDDIRLPARLRVAEALQAAVDLISCAYVETPDGPQKLFYVALIGGEHHVTFDNDGNLWNRVVPDQDRTRESIIGFITDPAFGKRVDDYKRRAARR